MLPHETARCSCGKALLTHVPYKIQRGFRKSAQPLWDSKLFKSTHPKPPHHILCGKAALVIMSWISIKTGPEVPLTLTLTLSLPLPPPPLPTSLLAKHICFGCPITIIMVGVLPSSVGSVSDALCTLVILPLLCLTRPHTWLQLLLGQGSHRASIQSGFLATGKTQVKQEPHMYLPV